MHGMGTPEDLEEFLKCFAPTEIIQLDIEMQWTQGRFSLQPSNRPIHKIPIVGKQAAADPTLKPQPGAPVLEAAGRLS